MAWQTFLAAKLLAEELLDMGDLEFLKGKADSGDLIIVTGTASTATELVAYTPANGKNFYIYKAKVLLNISNTGGIIAELQNDSVVKDYFIQDDWYSRDGGGAGSAGSSGAIVSEHFSIISGDKLVGNGTKKYRINITSITATLAYGIIIGWIENT